MKSKLPFVALCLCVSACGQQAQRPTRPPRPGVAGPGIQRSMSSITPVAVFPIEGTPDWQVITEDSVWVTNGPTNTVSAEIDVPSGSFSCVLGEDNAVWVSSTENNLVSRVDPKTNSVTDKISVGPEPRFLTAGAGSIWTLNQGDGTVSRVDVKTKTLVTNIQAGVPGTGGENAFGEGYVWATVFEIPLSQIDPVTNKVVRQWRGQGGDSVRAALGSV